MSYHIKINHTNKDPTIDGKMEFETDRNQIE